MKNTFGTNLSFTLFGESHGPAIGITIDGLPAGFAIDIDRIQADLEKRKPKGKISTQRREKDEIQILSGFFEGYTTGSPLTLLFENADTRSKDYHVNEGRLRPGHADFTAYEKYMGFQDYRGGGHFSGRLTTCIVAAGSICAQILEANGVLIGSHIEQLYDVRDDLFSFHFDTLRRQIEAMNQKDFAVLDDSKEEEMIQVIEAAASEGDSVGGILESAIARPFGS